MKSKLMKTLTLALAAVALVVVSVLGTMAYLTSSAAVANSFTIGNVGIQMYESYVDQNGVKTDANPTGEGARKTCAGNEYKLMPASSYVKDPTVYVNKGSSPSFLFIKVRNDIRSIEDSYSYTKNGETKSGTMRDQLLDNGFVQHHINDNVIVYVYGKLVDGVIEPTYVGNEEKDEVIDLFYGFKVKEGADTAKFGGARVSLVAYAIQANGFEGNADAAWNQIVREYPYESGLTGTTPTTEAVTEPTTT